MSAKTYSAGTIFLQVVPSYRGFMDQLRKDGPEMAREAGKALFDDKEWDKAAERAGERAGKALGKGIAGSKASEIVGESLEKGAEDSGKKAAEKYQGAFRTELKRGIAATQRELKAIKIDIDIDDAEVKAEVEQLKKELKSLGKAKIGVNLDADDAIARVAAVEKRIGELRKNASVNLDFDFAAAEVGVGKFRKKLESLHEAAEVVLDVDTKPAERQIGAFERSLKRRMSSAMDALGESSDRNVRRIKRDLEALDAEIGADMDTGAVLAQLNFLERELKAIAAESYNIDVKVDSAAAAAELGAVSALAKAVSADDVDIDVDVDSAAAMGKLAALGLAMRTASGHTQDGANSFRAFNAVILAAVTLGPALIPVLAGIAGGLLAIGPAALGAAAGLGVLAFGFTGIADAVKGLADVEKNAAKDSVAASKAIRNSLDAVTDAQRSLQRAREDAGESAADHARSVARAEDDAARAIEAALRRQEDAQRALADAQMDAREAQAALTQARKDAIFEIDDLNDRLRDGKLAERQAQIDLFNADVAYTAAIQDPGATNLEKEQASINLARAKAALSDIREELDKNGAEKKRIDKEGVDGTEAVQSAQDVLTDALERQRDAQIAVGDAAEAVDQARVDGAERVTDAIRAQRRAQEDAVEAISDAQRRLTRAQEDYQVALVETGEIGSESMRNLEEAMGKLSPAGRRFARWIFGLRDEFYGLRAIVQEGMLPGVQTGAETVFAQYGSGFGDFLDSMSRALGRLFVQAGRTFSNPAWQNFFGTMAEMAPAFMRMFGKTTLNWMTIFAELMVLAAPFAEKLGKALLEISENALEWMQSKEGQETWTRFFEFLEEHGPDIWEFFKDLFAAVLNLGEALMPFGLMMMEALGGILDLLGKIDPDILGLVAMGLLGIVAAAQITFGIIAIISSGLILFGTSIGLWVLGIVAIGIALMALWQHSETFRDIVKAVFRAIGDAAVWLWENALAPAFDGIVWAWDRLVEGAKWAWEHVLKPVFRAVGRVVGWLWENVAKPVFEFIAEAWSVLSKAFRWVWKNILWPIIDLVGTLIWKMWKFHIKVAFEAISFAWEWLSKGIRWFWNHVLEPIFDAFMDVIGDDLVNAFKVAVGSIGALWESLKNIIATPVRWVIETVLNNGIIKGFNKIAKFVGSDPMGTIPVPDFAKSYDTSGVGAGGANARGKNTVMGFATGGIYPGYTPGRDVGYIGVSGGEAIMRPEWTRAVGAGFVDQMNAAARNGGVQGVRRAMGFMGGFRTGGVVDDYRKVTYDNVTLNARTLRMLLAAEKLLGTRFDLSQGSYNVGVSASAGTHDGGGAFDAWSPFSESAITALRRVGFAAWRRFAGQGPWDPHIHGIALGDLEASPSARSQMSSFLAGGDGMGGTDYEPRPAIDYSLLRGIDISKASVAAVGSADGGLPGWLEAIIGKPVEWVNGLIDKGMDWVSGKVGDSPLLNILGGVPKMLVGGLVDTVQGWFGGADDEPQHAGDFRRGGVVNNGTMMYDNGGYLPPGLTSVLNLTGSPEPVFTAEQFERMSGGGAGIHYEPHFEGSDLTANDVADDLMFTLRSIAGGGKYAGRGVS